MLGVILFLCIFSIFLRLVCFLQVLGVSGQLEMFYFIPSQTFIIKMVSQTILEMFSVAIATFFVGAGATVQYVGGSVLQMVRDSYFFQNLLSIIHWKLWKPESATIGMVIH